MSEPQARRRHNATYYATHREQLLERSREYRATHAEQIADYKRRWKATHRELVAAQRARYRARRVQRQGSILDGPS